MARRLCFHIGAHKTASTMIQVNLRKNAKEISRELRVEYIQPQKDIAEIAGYFRDMSLSGGRLSSDIFDRAKNLLARAYAGGPDDLDLILSSEDFLGLCRPGVVGSLYPHSKAAFETLAAISPIERPKIILVVRRQDTYLESCYLQQIKRGQSITFSDFMSEVQVEKLSWLRIVEDLVLVFGRENVAVMPFESIKSEPRAFFLAFLEAVSGRSASHLDLSIVDQANASLSRLGLDLALQIYPKLSNGADILAVRNFLQEKFSCMTHPKAELLDEKPRRRILDLHRADNVRLFDNHMPTHSFARLWKHESTQDFY